MKHDKLEIKKHNSITDALTNYSLPAEKLLNAIYYTWQEVGSNSFDVPIVDLKKLIGMESDGNTEFLIEALKELRSTQSFRNFNYGGRDVKYHVGSFLSSLTIYKDNINFVKINIDPLIVSALQQRAGYTPLDLAIVEKFRTTYGLKLYQFYRRYKTLPNEGETIKRSLDDLNEYFGTNYKTLSELGRCIERGVKEIKKITNEEIVIKKNPKEKMFEFSWKVNNLNDDFMKFKKWFLKSFKGFTDALIMTSSETICINEKGYFFDLMNKSRKIGEDGAEKYWQILYDEKELWQQKHTMWEFYKAENKARREAQLF